MRLLKLIFLFLATVAITIGIIQLSKPALQQPAMTQQNIDINLAQPGPAPPPQYQYLQVGPGSPLYFRLAAGWPAEYYTCPQFFFYYEPGITFYRSGISVFLGCGWWYTPGVGCINIGYFHPEHRPFSSCPQHPQNRVVQSSINISNHNTTININKINVNVTPPQHTQPQHTPPPPPPHQPPPQPQHTQPPPPPPPPHQPPPQPPPHNPPHKK